jgi:hypothetical protein
MAHNYQTGWNKMKLFMEYEIVAQNVLYDNVLLAALMSGRKYNVIPESGDCSKESNARILIFRSRVRYQNSTSLQIHFQIMRSDVG